MPCLIKVERIRVVSVFMKKEIEIAPAFLGWCCSFGDSLKGMVANKVLKCFHDYIKRFVLKNSKTKLLHYTSGILKASQNVHQFVSLQDFTENSDIDWSKSVAEIDQQLYKKYNLSDEEIAFIESMIKPME